MNFFSDSYLREFDEKNNLKSGGLLYRIPSNPTQGYNFEYLLFIPRGMRNKTSLILESMNYKTCKTNNPKEKLEYMYENYKSFRNPIHYCNQNSLFPILYPLIPRYYDNILNEEIYLNMLSSNSFKVSNKLYERVDLQIINMINDAKRRLEQNNIYLDEKIIVHGFSASAKFANRFSILHPELVKLVIAGGLGGTLILPLRNIDNEKLLYPVGVGNFSEITDEKIKKFIAIKQFYYQGKKDEIDAFQRVDDNGFIPYYKGIINSDELKQIYKYLGKDINTRWENTQEIYNELCSNVILKTYENGEHNLNEAVEDIKKLLEDEVK